MEIAFVHVCILYYFHLFPVLSLQELLSRAEPVAVEPLTSRLGGLSMQHHARRSAQKKHVSWHRFRQRSKQNPTDYLEGVWRSLWQYHSLLVIDWGSYLKM